VPLNHICGVLDFNILTQLNFLVVDMSYALVIYGLEENRASFSYILNPNFTPFNL
jgi:hypothetical protein